MGARLSARCARPQAASAVDVEPAEADEVYNLMQDVRAMYLIVDTRSPEVFAVGHVDSAIHFDASSGAGADRCEPEALLFKRFEDLNLQSAAALPFSLCLCSDAQGIDAAAQEALQLFQRASPRLGPLTLSRAMEFSFAALQERFPFACTGYSGFEASRIFPSAIAERLFLSHWSLASDPFVVCACLGATHVVNCTPDLPCCFEDQGVAYMRVPVKDEQGADLLAHLEPAAAFIREALAAGGVVLAHCKHGQSRSASVLAAYLMQTRRWSRSRSLEHLQRCRPRVKPNPGFHRQLDEFEALLARGGRDSLGGPSELLHRPKK